MTWEYLWIGILLALVVVDWILAIVTKRCWIPGLKCRACREEERLKRQADARFPH